MQKALKCDTDGDDDDNLPIRLIIMVIIFPLFSDPTGIDLLGNVDVLSGFRCVFQT